MGKLDLYRLDDESAERIYHYDAYRQILRKYHGSTLGRRSRNRLLVRLLSAFGVLVVATLLLLFVLIHAGLTVTEYGLQELRSANRHQEEENREGIAQLHSLQADLLRRVDLRSSLGLSFPEEHLSIILAPAGEESPNGDTE